MRSRRPISIVSLPGLILMAMLYVALNILVTAWAPTQRLDLTDDGLFTLTEGTRQTLLGIDEPVELHLFFSSHLGREVPAYASYGRRVRELIREMTTASHGKLVLIEHDPEPFSDTEDLAVEFGIQGVPVDDGEELAWFGLAGRNSVDDIEKIDFFQPDRERLLEYDLTRLIHVLANPDPAVIGIVSSLPVMGDMHGQQRGGAQAGVLVPWEIGNRLRHEYQVMNLPSAFDRLPQQVTAMMVIQANGMNQRALYELEQFLFRGGAAVIFVDPLAESTRSSPPPSQQNASGAITQLLNHWGVSTSSDSVVGDKSMALKVNAGTAARPVAADYLAWLGVTPEYMEQADPITSQLPGLHLASAGHLEIRDDSTLSLQALVTSSENSSLIDVQDVREPDLNVLGLLEAFRPDSQTYVLAARLSGHVSTLFSDGPPTRTVPATASEQRDEPEPAQLMQSEQPLNVVIVSDTDILRDRFWLQTQRFFGRSVDQEIAGNGDFVMNIVGNLSGSNELSRLRTRGGSQRPFEKVDALQQQAARALQDKERALQEKLRETQSRINELQGVQTVEDAESGETKIKISITSEQKDELQLRREEMLSIRNDLREVQRGLRADVEKLEARLQFFNIGFVPLIVTGLALCFGLIRMLRRRRNYTRSQNRTVQAYVQ